MRRVSTDHMNNDMQFWLRRTERDMAKLETGMARQERLEKLRDDPLSAARAVRYESQVERLKRFEKNALYAGDQYKVSEGYVRQAVEITQRLREIAVQGANGVYTKEDQKYMAVEAEELLNELVALANARGPDGTFLFSGDKARTEPFRVIMGETADSAGKVITGVQYLGSQGGPKAEVTENSTVPLLQPGSEVFWAEKSQVLSGFDARDWRARDDGAFIVDGFTIEVKAGDTIQALAAKINESGAPVKASIDPRRFSLGLEATVPHQIRMEAAEGSGINYLAELGILADTGTAPDNLHPSARNSGGSLFDVAIRLRDSLNKGDVLETGGLSLAGLDAGLDNLNRRLAELGSRSERLETVAQRLNAEIPDTTRLLAAEKDLDITEAVTSYRMLEYAHKASLGFAGRLFPQTLLDFLR